MNPILFYDTFYVGVHEVPHKDSHSIHFTVQMADACSPITRQRNASSASKCGTFSTNSSKMFCPNKYQSHGIS